MAGNSHVFLSIASMILGAVAAIGQNNIKRLMAYSSIGHMGYALAGLATGTNSGIQSTIIYLIIYLVMNLGAFGCIFMMKRENIFYESIFTIYPDCQKIIPYWL